MKPKFFFIWIAGLACCVLSCDRESGLKPADKLELIFTVDDIQSCTTGAESFLHAPIVFTDAIYEKIITGDYDRLSFYVDNKPLLENIQLKWAWEVTVPYDYIVLSAGWGNPNDVVNRSFRIINATQKFEAEWNIFRKCLRDAGKIVPRYLLLTVDDIKSYNVTTFEIVFTDSCIAKFVDLRPESISFYFEGKPLLEYIRLANTMSGMTVNNLVLVLDDPSIDYYCFLADGCPVVRESEWDDLLFDDESKELWRKTREENAKKQEVEWNIFIRSLSDAGKLVSPPFVRLTIDDILSYNVTTSEIIFTDSSGDKLRGISDGYLSFYFEDKPVLEDIRIKGSLWFWRWVNDLVLSSPYSDGEFTLADGYPIIREDEWNNYPLWQEMQKKREENAKKRAVEWNLFIKYLSDAGKIVY